MKTDFKISPMPPGVAPMTERPLGITIGDEFVRLPGTMPCRAYACASAGAAVYELDQQIKRIVNALVEAEPDPRTVDVVYERPTFPAIDLVRITMIGIEIGRVTATWRRAAGGGVPEPQIDISVWSRHQHVERLVRDAL